MFTLVDLLKRVVLPERPLATRVADVMSAPIVTLPGSATAYEAMHVMAERGIRQIVAVEKGRPLGVINERDLFALQRVSMRDVNEGLHAADSIEDLKRAAEDIRRLTQNLLAQGVGAEPLTRTIASLNDALTRRAIDIVGRRHALDDIDWCWLALGSEGAASRRSPPTRTTRSCSRLPTRRAPRRCASACSRSRARSTARWTRSASRSARAT